MSNDDITALCTLLVGFLAPALWRACERLSVQLKCQPALTKRLAIVAITAAVSLGAHALHRVWPAFAWDPTSLSTILSSSLAFGLHAGDRARDANAATVVNAENIERVAYAGADNASNILGVAIATGSEDSIANMNGPATP